VIESSDLMTQQKSPGLGQAALQIGDVHVRNRVTIGGILGISDPWVDYPGVVLALEATIVAQESAGERTIDPSVFLPGFG